MKIRTFHSKVVGVTFENDDGSDRQAIIAGCRVEDRLVLTDRPRDSRFPGAIRVCTERGEQLGHLNEELAEEVHAGLAEGWIYEAVVSDLTGGTRDKPTRGCNIGIACGEPGAERLAVRVAAMELAEERLAVPAFRDVGAPAARSVNSRVSIGDGIRMGCGILLAVVLVIVAINVVLGAGCLALVGGSRLMGGPGSAPPAVDAAEEWNPPDPEAGDAPFDAGDEDAFRESLKDND